MNLPPTKTKVVSVPFDRATFARLEEFANDIGEDPSNAAMLLLRDLLADVEFWKAFRDTAQHIH